MVQKSSGVWLYIQTIIIGNVSAGSHGTSSRTTYFLLQTIYTSIEYNIVTYIYLTPPPLYLMQVDVEVLDVFVDSEDGLRVPVKLLDCDTMSQIKEKLLDATFKVSV